MIIRETQKRMDYLGNVQDLSVKEYDIPDRLEDLVLSLLQGMCRYKYEDGKTVYRQQKEVTRWTEYETIFKEEQK